MIAARRPGNAAAVKLLLERGANPNPNAHPATESSPLIEAATAGDANSMELLIGRGADAKAAAQPALTMAVSIQCSKCVDLLVAKDLDRAAYSLALPDIAALGDVNAVRLMLDHGPDVNAFDPLGRTTLMYASASDLLALDVVQLLIERGADVNEKDRHKQGGDSGLTVLDIAKLHGDTPVVEWLVKSGAKGTAPSPAVLKPRRENTIQSAIQGSIPLLQGADAEFVPKAACVSCHNNSLAAMALSAARKSGFQVNEKSAAQQVKANILGLEKLRDYLHQGFFVPVGDIFGPVVVSYIRNVNPRESWSVTPLDAAEKRLAEMIDPAEVDANEAQHTYNAENCGSCGSVLSDRGLFVDGRLRGQPMWGNMCANYFESKGDGIGWGRGQLYARQSSGSWRFVAGFRR